MVDVKVEHRLQSLGLWPAALAGKHQSRVAGATQIADQGGWQDGLKDRIPLAVILFDMPL